jgi:anti-anti-sigma factor
VEIQEQSHGAVTVLKPVGALTAAEAEQFKKRALEVLSVTLGRFIVDASAIPFVDSLGIEVLVDVTERLADGGRSLKVCAASPTLREVLELTGWGGAFDFFDEVQSGVRIFL